MDERVWKHRFAEYMSDLFIKGGMEADSAIAVCLSYADDAFPERDSDVPEQEAQAFYEGIADACANT